MPVIPQYRTQVALDANRSAGIADAGSTINQKAFDVVKRQGETQMKMLESQQAANERRFAFDVIKFGVGVVGNVLRAHSAAQIRTAATGTKAAFNKAIEQFQRNPNFEKFEEEFGTMRQDLLDSQLENITGAHAKKIFQAEFDQLAEEARGKISDLAWQKEYNYGRASTKYQIEEAMQNGDPAQIKKALYGYEANTPYGTYVVPGAVDNGYMTPEEAQATAAEAGYVFGKQNAVKQLRTVGPQAAIQALLETDEDGAYTFAPFLRDEDRMDMAKGFENEYNDQLKRQERARNDWTSKMSGQLMKMYNENTLTYDHLTEAADKYEETFGHVDEDFMRDLVQIRGWLENDSKQGSDQYLSKAVDAAVTNILIRKDRGENPEELMDDLVGVTEKYPGVISSSRYQSASNEIQSAKKIIPPEISEHITQLSNNSKNAIMTRSEAGEVTNQLREWLGPRLYNEDGTRNENAPSVGEIRDKERELLQPYYLRDMKTALEKTDAYMAFEGMGAGRYGIENKMWRKDIQELDAEDYTDVEQVINHFSTMVKQGDIDRLTEEEQRILEPYGQKVGSLYEYYFRESMGVRRREETTVRYYNGVLPIFEYEGQSYYLEFDPDKNIEYFAPWTGESSGFQLIRVGADGKQYGWNEGDADWTQID